jgi:flavin reductase (DIM6/NTAB) family NADH-FMN oxidoreductase RutF
MKYVSMSPFEQTEKTMEQLSKGAFLTTSKNGFTNTMTIAWGGVQIVWGEPFFVVFVRYSRHTYEMLEENTEFTVSIPKAGGLKEELILCGTQSGRDVNKSDKCKFTLVSGRKVNTPVIKECDRHYECKIRYRQAMEPFTIEKNVKSRYYKTHDYHVMLWGEIVDSYRLED